jgi:predicted ATP-grasp superfamily ATP-dependent carboligase
MRVFVTDGDNRATLAVTRSLGRQGHAVIVGERRQPSLAQASRHCAGAVTYPDPVAEGDAFVGALQEIVAGERIDVLLPMADVTTFLVLQARAAFESTCRLPLAPTAALETAADKVAITALAGELGVAVPRGVVVEGPAIPAGFDLPFPIVIKPGRSRIQTAGAWKSTGVSFAADRAALERDLSGRPAYEYPVLLQERISGEGLGVFACYHHGRSVALFAHRRLRERPPWGGVSVLSESVALESASRDGAVALLDRLGWHGVAMVEFKRDDRDGTARLMEINGRFWGSLQLAIDAGVDFPALVLRATDTAPFPPQTPYRVGVRSRWLWGDIDSLLLTLRSARGADGEPSRRGRAVLEFNRWWGRDLYYENPRWEDLRPWLYETRRWFRRLRPPAPTPSRVRVERES